MTIPWRAVVFVEGISDARFIHCYLNFLRVQSTLDDSTPDNDTVLIYDLGTDSIIGKNLGDIEKPIDNSDKALFIFDADSDIARKRKYTAKIRAKIRAKLPDAEDIAFFLFPNDKAEGELETLLRAISIKQDIYTCLDRCKKCLTDLGHKESPDVKGEIYAYCQAAGDKPHPEDRKYSNPKIWDLKSEALTPLKNFLTQHLL